MPTEGGLATRLSLRNTENKSPALRSLSTGGVIRSSSEPLPEVQTDSTSSPGGHPCKMTRKGGEAQRQNEGHNRVTWDNTIDAAVAIVVATSAVVVAFRGRKIEVAITENTRHINSRMDDLIKRVETAALAKGKLEGRAEEQDEQRGRDTRGQ